ncbi:MAG: DUF2723 domain-containing protein [Candidatus Marinimicrobia bacterium]|nr:DUF2723 domain-containing protein [Candidatus Neomarinimicrobiota bacterium]MBL7022604.1 DUF2723 domain-containing protein [Candidatus Neomarinimicrobiota bacterium]MBL7109861.1 DUF2723 domain-containing protein [Candidatus Neomarinimicrobiota bacterium]
METNPYLRTNRILAGVVFLFSLVVYLLTMAPTTSFWDCGEFIATSTIMGVPHPPGSPFYLLLGNVFSQIPFFSDIGARVNLISPLVSALAVMLLYLIIVQLIEEWRGRVSKYSDALIAFGSAFLGALTFAFTDSHWFNAVEAEVYAMSTFFTAIVVWLILKWSQNEGQHGNVRYILIIAYIIGLAIGTHLLNLLALPFIALVIYYKKFKFSFLSFIVLMAITGLAFLIIYLGIIKGLPNMTNKFGWQLPLILIISAIVGMIVSIKKKQFQVATLLTSLVLILIGYSTYTAIFVRATQHPAINENNPDTFAGAVSYLNREQYGDWDILDRAASLETSAYSNRYTRNPQNPKSVEVRSFFWDYQVKEMYLRYFGWQFIGRGGFDWEVKTLSGKVLKHLEGINWFRYGLPLAFLLGLAGLAHHFFRDWKNALAVLTLFLLTGFLIIIYLNQYDPQPRERDYSYVGSFFAFSIFIGIGIAGLLERLKEFIKDNGTTRILSWIVIVLLFIAMPVKMLSRDYDEHNRSGNFVAWDYAYNMLNSCEPNGIVFTNGDNDTFPLWYLQEVEGVRKDVRVVNLSLLNTPWYIEQLRDDEPKIPLVMADQDIKNIMPIQWDTKEIFINGPTANSPKFSWKLKPTYAGRFLRVQDLMIYRIIKDCEWKRPIYFAVTVSGENRIGLENYLQMEGMVFRVRPEKTTQLNPAKMRQNITETNNLDNVIRTPEDYKEHIETGDGVYRYYNLNNQKITFNSNIQRLTQNYRSAFLQLALEDLYSQDSIKKARAVETLNLMDGYFPSEILPFNNPELELQVARMYYQLGQIEDFKLRLDKILNRPGLPMDTKYYVGQLYLTELRDFNKSIEIFSELHTKHKSVPDFMTALVQVYAQADSISEAISVLENWLISYPADNEAREMLKLLKPDSL